MSIKEVAARIMSELDAVRGTGYPHEKKLKDGIVELAAACGTELRYPCYQTVGELQIITTPESGAWCNGCRPYGEAFAALLTGTPHRTGAIEYGYHTGEVLPQNGWCYVPYHEVENMIRKAAAG